MGRLTVAFLALGVALTLAPLSTTAPRSGGTFLVEESAAFFDSIDQALSTSPYTLPWLSTACASLMRLQDRPLPAGFRVAPELAAGFPKVSADGRTYVFTIRKDARFSTGAPVTAADVAYTIDRVLSPALKSPNTLPFQPIVGSQAVLDGTATSASGIVASRDTLTIRLKRRVADFVENAASSLCVLPAGSPISPQGVTAPVPSAAPYYISEYVPEQRIVLERNPYYRGPRPQNIDRFVGDLTIDDAKALDDVANGTADYAYVSPESYTQRAAGFAKRFGVNRSRFFVEPSWFLRLLVLNTSRPLLRDNVPLRQAINYAIERTALLRQLGPYAGVATDQFLPPIMPGYADAQIYPLVKPDLAKARALAKGHTRSGRLVLYWNANHPTAEAEIIKQDLARIGLKVVMRTYPGVLFFTKLATRGEPFDMADVGWGLAEPDPGNALNELFDGGLIGTPSSFDWSYFDSPKWNRALRTASQLTGEARLRAYGKLDVELARNAAPAVAYGVDNALTLVSSRTGCVIANPYLDLAAVCLKQ
jgi:peptide/nickel transport system substrate-binding protein